MTTKKNETGKAQILEATELGKNAFLTGQNAAPFYSKELPKIVGYRMQKDTPKGEATFTELMKAFSDGWQTANLENARKLFL